MVDATRKIHWTSKELETFLDGMLFAFARLDSADVAARDRLLPALERFLAAVRGVSVLLYPLSVA